MISILLPFKNEASFILNCFESIANQTEKDFEVIAVDDHSEDDSHQIALNFSKKDKRFNVIKNAGTGVIKALQTAYTVSRGQYISRQDADDLMPVHKLKTLKTLLDGKGPGHIATGKVQYFSNDELKEGFRKYESWLNDLCIYRNHYEHIFKECVICSANWLMYKADFEKLNYFETVFYPEDYFLVFKLKELNFKIECTEEVTHLWRDHPNRASRTSALYQNQNFFPLKIYFLKKFYSSHKFVLWGAGPNGKELAQKLLCAEIEFSWLAQNSKKIGKHIYEKLIHDPDNFAFQDSHLVIICSRQRNAISQIKEILKTKNVRNFLEF
jgi:glycosyltransferase involved in cell wall biosynthesis